jgi:hypothetical protein
MASNRSNISANLERLNYGSADGCVATGLHREVISGQGATLTLLPEESGALVVLDRAAGCVVTLPTPVVGAEFEFRVTVSRTSNSYKIITAAATQFLVGSYLAGDATIATSGDIFTGDGTTHVALTFDGDTKGGLVGGCLVFTAISSTVWSVEGIAVGTGTMVTAFATS